MPTELKLDIGEAQIQNAIAVALAESFTDEKRDALLRDIVRAHLSAKTRDYSKETMLNAAVGRAIREEAMAQLNTILEERLRPAVRPVIEGLVSPKFVDSVVKQLEDGIARKLCTNISISAMFEDEDWDG